MKLPRKIAPDELNDLKAVTRQALDIARPSKFALVTRVEAAVLSKYGSPAETDKFMGIDVAVELCRDIGAPLVVEEMARLLGYRLEPLAAGDAGAVDAGDLADVHRETAEVVQTLARALPDGIDTAERRDLRREISQGITALHRLDRKVAGGAP
jgi:hypothetical protein